VHYFASAEMEHDREGMLKYVDTYNLVLYLYGPPSYLDLLAVYLHYILQCLQDVDFPMYVTEVFAI
jgi:hypothetical protein